MSNCTQLFSVIIKGENHNIESFKEYYSKGNSLLTHKGSHTDFSYNSKHSKVWMDQTGLFSFFIMKYRRSNKDFYYSIEKLAQRFPELEFYYVFIIEHTTIKDAKLSSEGYEIFKNGNLYDSCQMAREAFEWDIIILQGVPDMMYEVFLKMKYINQLLKHQNTKMDLISKFDNFTAIPKAGICENSLASFSDIIDEKEFFNTHLDEFRLVIQNQIRTGIINGKDGTKYKTKDAQLSLLNFALIPYIIDKIPELNEVLNSMTQLIDSVVERIGNKELDPEEVLLIHYEETNYYDILEIFESNSFSKYDEIYKLMNQVNSSYRLTDDDVPF